jgi:molybdate transport system substrate-binding protein
VQTNAHAIRSLLALAALVVVAGGCAREEAPLTVHAAASLTSVLPRVASSFSAVSGPVRFHFGASSRLAKQIEAGAPGDAFFSADSAWMDYLDERGLLRAGTRRDLLENALVVVVPAGSSLRLASLADLARADVPRVALAAEGVPAGRYARAALEESGVLAAVSAKAASADDVRMALAWVARGEADAGIVYVTDAKAEPRVQVALALPSELHAPVVIPAAVLAGAKHPAEAEAFLTHCEGDAARALFEAAGFTIHRGAP